MPDLVFVDVRAVAGVTSQYGGLGGLGTLGAPAGAAATAQTAIPSLAGNAQGLNRDNEVQTTSFGISPYLLRQFGDWGTGKLGYSLNVTQIRRVDGFLLVADTDRGRAEARPWCRMRRTRTSSPATSWRSCRTPSMPT